MVVEIQERVRLMFLEVHLMFLEVQIDNGADKTLCYLTNEIGMVQRPWPMIKIQQHQTNGTISQVYHLELAAAPLLEIWFSTKSGFHHRPEESEDS